MLVLAIGLQQLQCFSSLCIYGLTLWGMAIGLDAIGLQQLTVLQELMHLLSYTDGGGLMDPKDT